MISKSSWRDLAIFGGEPLFAEPLHVGKPNLGMREAFDRFLDEIFARHWLTNDGPLVRRLEERLAEVLEVPHVVAVSNGTAGLEVLARALDLTGEVIVPSFTFVATAHAFRWLGLKPVFADVRPDTHLLDPQQVAALITPHTSAIAGVHLWGQACYPEELQALAAKHDLALIFDAAHAFGARHAGCSIGGFGQAEVFSFHATKLFHTFEGGAITTRDGDLARRIRLMRNFGFAGIDQVVSLGTNAKMSEVAAAMGLTLLERLPELLASARETFLLYRQYLAGLPGVRLLPLDPEHNTCQYIVLEVDPATMALCRDEIVEMLRAENVLARRYFTPGVHRMAPYAGEAHAPQPVTERLVESVIVLPAGALAPDVVEQVCHLLAFLLEHQGTIAGQR